MSALTLVVLIIAGDAKEAATASLKRAAEQTLGADTSVVVNVVVRTMPRALDDDGAIGLERSLHAYAIAEVAWSDTEPPVAHVHLHVASTSRWIDRNIGFSHSDAPSE